MAHISQETGISVQPIRRYRRNMAKYDLIRAPKGHRPRKLDVEQEEVRSRMHRKAQFSYTRMAFFDALLIKFHSDTILHLLGHCGIRHVRTNDISRRAGYMGAYSL